ncbi:beta-ketoacyl synthase [Antarcticibacterium sp. 1MA-6-2]|uniref:beta-ketoacyl synthase N-terminal-like domain-containing protein n=1 Tax=Antarcticibacterium sp. 1MA-6-2 TaxID=2908210 RepID=UPI001F1F7AA2|nr:beta-ketoacyl synthase N-terminal-like domain-containing protein [Antarcticibacterium sp. 1MA-6-2]UJH91647.1 beta-ketoacyl synthase [Antarcticibacterium sp. 1MA-6-2]
MKGVYLLDDSIISPLGFSTEENLQAIRNEKSALQLHKSSRFSSGSFYAGSLDKVAISEAFEKIGNPADYTKLEQMMLLSVDQIIKANPELDLNSTGLVISTTKGNIDLLGGDKFSEDRILLSELGEVIRKFFGFKLKPIVVSNACISGGLAMTVAAKFIEAGKFENAVVVGGDLVSDFVVFGFQSFQAISDQPCKPFSNDRNGISIGEAAAAVLLGSKPKKNSENVKIIGEASVNDANHISGPSRTGEGLFKSIQRALAEAEISAERIDYVSAHGTATIFNDEMEAIAFHRSGFQKVPLNSYKGYYGHTMGASALLESILTKHCLLNNELFSCLNYNGPGTSKELSIISDYRKQELNYALKTASGFGGCNLAMVLKKEQK